MVNHTLLLDEYLMILHSPASPYLLSLGLSKPLMAVVFLAGPLSGLIVQPLIGTSVVLCIFSYP